jgi:transcriptional regulator with XRE-family HTH domain
MRSETQQRESRAAGGLRGPGLSPRLEPDIARELRNPLGAYLQARRAQVRPEQKGLRTAGVRRVPGLRREEVALLAGISADYYLRLETGRDRNPSAQVLDSIARVLELDDAHVAHVHALAAAHPTPRHRAEALPPGAESLLHALTVPAFVETMRFDVVAANAAARAVSPRLAAGRNRLRDLVLDDDERALIPAWKRATECLVGNLRQTMGEDIADSDLIRLVSELSAASPGFRAAWARHDVQGQYGGPITLGHPRVGTLTLNRERMAIDGTDGLLLVTLHADAGSRDAEKLAALIEANGPASGPAAGGRR